MLDFSRQPNIPAALEVGLFSGVCSFVRVQSGTLVLESLVPHKHLAMSGQKFIC